MTMIPLFLAFCGLFLIAGIAVSIIEKTGQPEMAKTLSLVMFVAGLGIAIGMLTQLVTEVTTVFKLY